MNELSETYNNTKVSSKRPFDIDEITESLMSEPLSIDLNQIAHTPVGVMVMMPKEEYMKKRIAPIITRKFEGVHVCCKEDMLILKAE